MAEKTRECVNDVMERRRKGFKECNPRKEERKKKEKSHGRKRMKVVLKEDLSPSLDTIQETKWRERKKEREREKNG